MNLNKKEFSVDFAGKPLKLTVSKIAEQANAAVMGQYGDTIVLATVVMGKEDRKIDYFPLTVDYEERFYAAGKIIGSRFVRREGRPSQEAVLSGRLVDRAIRPLFDHRLRRDVQIVLTILSYDEENDPDFLALLTASMALATSEIPWQGPVAGVKIARLKNGETIINPANSQLSEAGKISFESFASGTAERLNMLELSGNESPESEIIESFSLAHNAIKQLIDFQKDVVAQISKPKAGVFLAEPDAVLVEKVRGFLSGKLEETIYQKDKVSQHGSLSELKKSLREYLATENSSGNIVSWDAWEAIFEEELDKLVHKNILEKELRPDGRKLDEVRELYSEVGLFKRLHGSALFIRGGTQALAVTTLAAPGAEQLVETMETTAKRRFMLHYNFPPFSTGEIGRMGAPGRREIGHGALAEKAMRSMIPTQDEFPYTIRVVSEILASNGSSSMATVCASSLSLMDAGVPLKETVAGIAMGLMTRNDAGKNNEYKILTDIQGPEDHYGDMDCKVAGTRNGVNAMQMDVKIDGVTVEMLKEVLEQAKKARLEILAVMNKSLSAPRESVSEFAPVIMTVDISPEQIGAVIGPGGKIINSIIRDTGVSTIDIEESGRVFVAAAGEEQAHAAIRFIHSLTKEYAVGEIVEGPVIKILEFGAIVDLGGGKDGMIHVSELKDGFVKKVEDVIKMGDFVRVKVVKVENGKIGLSLKAMGK